MQICRHLHVLVIQPSEKSPQYPVDGRLGWVTQQARTQRDESRSLKCKRVFGVPVKGGTMQCDGTGCGGVFADTDSVS